MNDASQSTTIPFIDLCSEYQGVASAWQQALARVGESGQFIQGPEVAALEAAIAARVGVSHGVAVGSGTDALVLALKVLDLQPGDEVITTPFSFAATVEAILRVGATPVFADIEPTSYNVDPSAVTAAISPRTRAILPVHLYGRMADMDSLLALAERHGLAVVEDTAQAFGACWQGRAAGSLGLLGCYSFYPTKVLGGVGDGGMVVTDDATLAARLRRLRNHGLEAGCVQEWGFNSRLDEVQAAWLNLRLPGLDEAIQRRGQLADQYQQGLADSGLRLPEITSGQVVGVYTVAHRQRDALCAALGRVGIGTRVYYPRALHAEPCCAHLAYRDADLPQATQAAQEVFSLPLYPGLSDAHQVQVIEVLRQVLMSWGGC